MFQIFIQRLAQAALEKLFTRNQKQYHRLEKAIDEIEKGTKQDYLRWILYIQSAS